MRSMPQRRGAKSKAGRAVQRLSPVAAAVSSFMISTGAAQAQQTPAPAAEAGTEASQTIVVTGIRRAIESSIAAKRNADQILEAVSAEDIGKLPDNSIGDSIARLPGLTSRRIDGRQSAISIRGLGPDYAGGLLNGRQVVSSGEGRSAEYDQFPSELVNQVLVYKTPDGALIGQGLSGTVDIRPVLPLSLRGRQVVLNARGERNSNGGLSPQGNGATGNRLSASYIDQFADNTVGLAIGFAHLDTPGQSKKYESWRYGDYVGQWGAGATGVPSLGVGNNRAQFAQGFEASVTSSKQVRDGLMAVIEFRPNSSFHSVVDLYYSKFDQDRVSNFWAGDIGLWSGGAQFSNVGTTVVDGNTIISSGTVAGVRNLVYQKNFNRTDKISSLGWRNELKLPDKWSAIADLGYSRADRDEYYVQSVARGQAGGTLTFSGLDATGAQNWTTNENLADPANVQLTNSPDWAELRTPTYQDEIKSLRLSGKRDLDLGFLSRIETGLAYNQRDKTVASDSFSLRLASPNVLIPGAALGSPVNIAVGGANATTVTWDIPSIMGLYTVAPKDPWSAKDNKYGVHEKVTTAYAKVDLDSELSGIPVRGNVGMQIVRSEQHSDGYAWNDPGGTPGAPGASVIPVSGGASYNDYLPSVNLIFNLQADLVARLGLAKTMARPRMDDMRAGADQPKLVAISPGSTIGTWQAGNGGKPDLQPWRAKSLDLSLEKYFGKASYLAGAAFYKKLDTFIYKQKTVRDFSGFPNYSPTLTPGCSPSAPDCDPNLGTITTEANGEGGKVWGIELAASLDAGLLTPALQGFGVIVSESITRKKMPLDAQGNPIELSGFSGTVNNLTLYYEAHGFSARASQRYRSAYTDTSRGVLLNTETNTHYAAERQIDLQVGYSFNSGMYKGLSILFQVNNLTDEPVVQTRGPEVVGSLGNIKGQLPWKTETYGRSVLLGVGYKF